MDRLKIPDMPDWEKIGSEVYVSIIPVFSAVLRAEDEVVKTIAEKVLGRDPKIEDAGRFSKIHHETDPLKYYLAFDGVILGSIAKNQYGVEFVPHKDFQ